MYGSQNALRQYREKKAIAYWRSFLAVRALRSALRFFASLFADGAEVRKSAVSMFLVIGLGSGAVIV